MSIYFDILPYDIKLHIIQFIIKKIPKTLFLISTKITNIVENIMQNNKKFIFREKKEIYKEKTLFFSYETMILPVLHVELTPNNYEEIEYRLLLISNKHPDLFIDARRFYKHLLTKEFADFILNKYGIDNIDYINDSLSKLSNNQFTILIILHHVRYKDIILQFFPDNQKHLINLKEKFKEAYF